MNPQNQLLSALQLYFHDTDYEIQNRQGFSGLLLTEVLEKLRSILTVNPYAKFFRTLINISDYNDFSIIIKDNHGLDQWVFNAPPVSQVAAVWVEDNSASDRTYRDIIVHGLDNQTHTIGYDYGCYDPLQYPLLFPFGEIGWHVNIGRTLNRRNQPPPPNIHVQDLLRAEQPGDVRSLI